MARNDPQNEVEKLERKKLVVLAQKAIERSRRLIAGSREAVERAQQNCDNARVLRETFSPRRKAA